MPIDDAALTEMPGPSETIGRYRLIHRVGEGAFAEVFFARDEESLAPVAVKVLRDDIDPSIKEQVRVRFLAEEKITHAVGHRYVINIRETSPADARPCFLAMDFVAGRPFCDHLARYRAGRMTATRPSKSRFMAEVARLGHQVASAMAAAHAKGIVHRDLKPGNVLVTCDTAGAPEVRILDFGIAKAPVELFSVAAATSVTRYWTELGTVMGSPPCMAPEQCGAAQAVTGQADVFALGVMLFGALLGLDIASLEQSATHLKLPDDVDNSLTLRGPLSPEWEQLLRRMLARNPAERPQMEDVALRLQRLARQDSEFGVAVEAWVRQRQVPRARQLLRVLKSANRASYLTDDEQRFIQEAPIVRLTSLRRKLAWVTTATVAGAAGLTLVAVWVQPFEWPSGGGTSVRVDAVRPQALSSVFAAESASASAPSDVPSKAERELTRERERARTLEATLTSRGVELEGLKGKLGRCQTRGEALEADSRMLSKQVGEQKEALERCDGESERLLDCRQESAKKSQELAETTQRLQMCSKSLRGGTLPPTGDIEMGMSEP